MAQELYNYILASIMLFVYYNKLKMKKEITLLIPVLILSMQSLQAAPSQIIAANKTSNVMQRLNNHVGLRALESFAGKDRLGKDGPMVRLGMDLSLLYQEHRDFKMKGGEQVLRRPFTSSLPHARIKNEKIVIDYNRCIGCGACTFGCPNGVLALEKKKETDLYIPPANLAAAYMDIAVERGKI